MRKKGLLVLGLVLFAGLAWLFALFDLEISQKVVNPDALFAQVMEVTGELTTPVLGLFASGILFFSPLEGSVAQKKAGRIFLCCGAVGLGSYPWLVLPGYFDSSLPLWAGVLMGTATAGLSFFLCSCIPFSFRQRYAYVAAVCLLSILLGLLAVELLKNTFGRVRFREMAAPYQEFTPWYVVNGYTGSRSFPSGHTAHAAVTLALASFADYPQHRGKRPWIVAGCLFWTVLMGIARVRIGAHFASDVLFGAVIMGAVVLLSRRILRKYRPN